MYTFFCLLACSGPAKVDAPAPPDDTGARTDTSGPLWDIEAEVSPYVTTVVTVRWRTAEPTIGWVEFGETDAYGLLTPPTAPSTEHEVLLLGMPADTEVHFRVVADIGASADLVITTGSLPAGLYPTRVEGDTASLPGWLVLPIQGTNYAIAIVDGQGRYVWYHLVEGEGNISRALLSNDGASVLYCLAGPQDALELGKLVRVSLDGSVVTETPWPYADHDVVEHPDGTLAAIVVEPRGDLSGDTIQELAPDGTISQVWSAWDAWDPETLNHRDETNWVHGNGLDYDPDADVYYLSMRTLGSLVKIDRPTGEVLWGMNGQLNDFAWGPSGAVQTHHQFEVLGDTVLFFENGPLERLESRAVEVVFDEEARTAQQVWHYAADPAIYVFAKGDVHRLGDGSTLVVWSSAGEVEIVDGAGTPRWRLDLDLGLGITFVQVVGSLYAGG